MTVAFITIGVMTVGIIAVGASLYFTNSDPDKDDSSDSHKKPRHA